MAQEVLSNGFKVLGAVCEILAARLYGAVDDLTDGAVLSCSHEPIAGSLASLQLGQIGSCTFRTVDMNSPGFWLRWVLPQSRDVIRVEFRLGAGARIDRFDVARDGDPAGSLAMDLSLEPVGDSVSFNVENTDPYWESVAAALDFEGRDLLPGVTATLLGGAAIDTTTKAAGSASLKSTGGQGNYLKLAGLQWSRIWTIEGWLRKNTSVSHVGGECLFRTSSAPVISVYMREGTRFSIFRDTSAYPASVGNVVLGEWAPFAAVANGSVVSLFIGGIKVGEEPYTDLAAGDLWIAGDPYPNQSWNGNVDGIKITMGVAKYTSGYRPEYFRLAASRGPLTQTTKRGYETTLLQSQVLPSEARPVPQGLQSMARYRASKLMDVECGGQGRIYGTVSRKETPANVPLRRRVRLHRSVDGYLARETWSKADGSYEFREISTRYEWDVIAWDHELQEFSTVANNQLAEVA
ncbi:LamG-like jellyroll fold domain-containing protein [Comamonas testosteroni]|uniref:LamG-like jellyroll fold domain-containing protein n=1 Tax=Comamonas testosteroni TaxID=285 RepID=UPI00068C59C7|nr:LamG-like jellyroll fold domain-containing protein [Comamonas testosteroni]